MISQLSSSGVPNIQEEAGHTSLEYSSLSLEWREARLSMDRFDKITVDLRFLPYIGVLVDPQGDNER